MKGEDDRVAQNHHNALIPGQQRRDTDIEAGAIAAGHGHQRIVIAAGKHHLGVSISLRSHCQIDAVIEMTGTKVMMLREGVVVAVAVDHPLQSEHTR